MKKIIFVFSFLQYFICNAQWTQVNVNDTSDLIGIGNYGPVFYILGSTNLIKSFDNGNTWNSLTLIDEWGGSLYGTLSDAYFFNDSVGVACGPVVLGNNASILRTTNGGGFWSYVYSSSSGNWPRIINDLDFFNTGQGFAVGTNGCILKTLDQGLTWTTCNSGTIENINEASFYSITGGSAVTDNNTYKTTNSGASWSTKGGKGESISYGSSTIGYTAGGSKIYKTIDSGNTWSEIIHPTLPYINKVFALNKDTVFLATSSGLFVSKDGGLGWEFSPELENIQLNNVHFFNNIGFAVGNGGIVYKTMNYGGLTKPISEFNVSQSTICTNTSIQFNNSGSASNTYQWLIDSVLISTDYNFTFTFTNGDMNHIISLVAFNGSLYDTSQVSVYVQPEVSLSDIICEAQSDTVCLLQKTYILVYNSEPGVSYSLYLGSTQVGVAQSGNNGTLSFQTNSYSSSATSQNYIMKAYKYSACGSLTKTDTITIYNGTPDKTLPVLIDTTWVCKGFPATFHVANSQIGVGYCMNNGSYNYGDTIAGTGDTISLLTTPLLNDYTWKVSAISYLGCTATLYQQYPVYSRDVMVNFTVNSNGGYVGNTIEFDNYSTADSYVWQFDSTANQLYDTTITPESIHYDFPGVKNIMLTGTATGLCSITATKSIPIYNPNPIGAGDVCSNTFTLGKYIVTDLFIDSLKNKYLTGYFNYNTNYYRIFVQKIDSVGNIIWTWEQPYNYQITSFFGTAIVADQTGNVYVSAHSYGSRLIIGGTTISSIDGNYQPWASIIKFNTIGNIDWFVYGKVMGNGYSDQTLMSTDITIDNQGRLFCTGLRNSITMPVTFYFSDGSTHQMNTYSYDCFLMKLNNNGILQNFYEYGAASGDKSGYTESVIVGSTTGLFLGITPKLIVDYNGDLLIGSSILNPNDYSNRQAYFGSFILNFDKNASYVAKFSTSNGWVSVTKMSNGKMFDFETDNFGNIYSLGQISTNYITGQDTLLNGNNQSYYYLSKANNTGYSLWNNFNNSVAYKHILVNDNNDLFLSGNVSQASLLTSSDGNDIGLVPTGASDFFLSEFSNDGKAVWARIFGANLNDYQYVLNRDKCNDLYLCSGKDNKANVEIMKFATDGYCEKENCVPVIPSVYSDIGIKSINSPENVIYSGQHDISFLVKNYGTDTISDFNINWTIDSSTINAYNWVGNLLPGQTISVLNVDTFNFTNGTHLIKAWTSLTGALTDTINFNDTLSSVVFASSDSLHGIYTIGQSQSDFLNFNQAVYALTLFGVDGPVVFNVKQGDYYEQITIPPVAGSSVVNTIIFQSESGDSSDVRLRNDNSVPLNNDSTNYLVRLDGAQYITFNNITFMYDCPALYSIVVELKNGASNNTFTNNSFIGFNIESNLVYSSIHQFLLFNSGNTVENNIHIINNLFKYGTYGIQFNKYVNAINYESGLVVRNNTFKEQLTGSIDLHYETAVEISGNNIISHRPPVPDINYTALSCTTCPGNISVILNKITCFNSSAWSLYLIGCYGTYASLVANNVINNLSSGIGLYIKNCQKMNIYHNTIKTQGLNFYYNQLTTCIMKNNLFYNDSGQPVVDAGYMTSSLRDYNNYYTSGATLALSSGSNWASSLLQMQTGGNDAHSLSVIPHFFSDYDLHLLNDTALMSKGVYLTTVINDIDGETRDTINPDIGVDECNLVPVYSNVWPGDANNDNQVNNFDLLSIGLGYEEAGLARNTITDNWAAQVSADWFSTQLNGQNMKYADCNGDGIVNLSDTSAIITNYSMSNLKSNKVNKSLDPVAPIYLVPVSDFVAGEQATVEIWAGTGADPVENILGLVFHVNINQNFIETGSLEASYSQNWLGTPGLDAVKLAVPNESLGFIDGAFIRTDFTNRSGYGKIAEFSFIINLLITNNDSLTMSVSSDLAVAACGDSASLAESEINVIVSNLVSEHKINNPDEMKIYPNPATDEIFIEFSSLRPQTSSFRQYGIYGIEGKLVKQGKLEVAKTRISIKDLESGVYFVKVISDVLSLSKYDEPEVVSKLVITR